jgi:hypothetical protein
VCIPVLICEDVTGRIGGRNPRRGRRFADQNELLGGVERYPLRYNGIAHKADADHPQTLAGTSLSSSRHMSVFQSSSTANDRLIDPMPARSPAKRVRARVPHSLGRLRSG